MSTEGQFMTSPHEYLDVKRQVMRFFLDGHQRPPTASSTATLKRSRLDNTSGVRMTNEEFIKMIQTEKRIAQENETIISSRTVIVNKKSKN
jgi:hypothetical protein